jgi:hypothetical protein
MTEDMRELIYSYEDSDHFDIVTLMNEVYDDEVDPFDELTGLIKLDMMIALGDDEPVSAEDVLAANQHLVDKYTLDT